MTRLAPHLLVPAPPDQGCFDIIAAWLRKWLFRALLVGLGFVAGCAYHAMVVGK